MLQFADFVNRYDFIDSIVRWADPSRFEIGVCVRTRHSNIEPPNYSSRIPFWILEGLSRKDIPRTAYRLARLLREWQADILHAHHYDQALIGLLATRMARRTRLIIGRHYSDAIYRSTRGWKRAVLLGLEQLANHRAARIVVPSQQIAELITRRQNIVPTKVDRVPYGFVTEKYTPPSEEAVRQIRDEFALDGRFVIGTFGRLHEEKGQRFLVEALRQLRPTCPELVLLVVGDGPERAALERQVHEAELDGAVHFAGWRRDVPVVMSAVDVIAQPTLHEAFSQVMAEALWMGKPLVITEVSGALDIIRSGENGLLVPKGDAGALAQALRRLVNDPALCRTLAANGQAYVREQLTIEKVIPQYENVYLRALGV